MSVEWEGSGDMPGSTVLLSHVCCLSVAVKLAVRTALSRCCVSVSGLLVPRPAPSMPSERLSASGPRVGMAARELVLVWWRHLR